MQDRIDVARAASERPGPSLRRPRVLRAIGPTLAAELQLRRALRRLLLGAATFVRRHALPLVASTTQQLSADAGFIADTVQELGTFSQIFRNYIAANLPQYGNEVDSILRQEEGRHRSAFQGAVRAATGVDVSPVLRSSDVGLQVQAAVLEHVEQVRGITDDLARRVTTTIVREAGRGTRADEVGRMLSEQFGWSQRRARLIARDQLASYNGVLNHARQEQIGVDRYVWSTSLDERVRPLHAEREGRTYSWDDPPSDGHPGEPINCRCVARAVIEP